MSNLNFIQSYIEGLYIIEGKESKFNEGDLLADIFDNKLFSINNIEFEFTKELELRLKKGALRGIYYNNSKNTSKLVRVTKGEVYFVVVDLRIDASTFGKYYGILLSEDNGKQLYIPDKFGYGILVTSDSAVVNIKTTDIEFGQEKYGIIWNDRELNIEWLLSKTGNISILRQDYKWPAFALVAKALKNGTI